MNDERNISPGSGKNAEDEKLLRYLDGNMSSEEMHSFESQMNDDEFINDAVEGLEVVENKKKIAATVQQLNAGLKKQIEKRKSRNKKRRLLPHPDIYFVIICLLLLIVISWLVIKGLK